MKAMNPLRYLHFQENAGGLCAPSDIQFQHWASRVIDFVGPTCAEVALIATISDQIFVQDRMIADLTLPEAVDGPPPYAYSLDPSLPAGLTFDATERMLSGTPTTVQAPLDYVYTVLDGAGMAAADTFTIEVLSAVSVTAVPSETELLEVHGNYPNPFGESTTLELTLARNAEVSIEIFDMLGRRVLGMKTQRIAAGLVQRLPIAGLQPTSGVLLYRVVATANSESATRTGRIMLVQ